ncbi:hypothetical protein TNCV_4019171 [Trichonephila clavipes]|nr:hypothetical protein TNCV_4019171 [Trichonephila clavipes]
MENIRVLTSMARISESLAPSFLECLRRVSINPVCQDSTEDVLPDSGLEIELTTQIAPNQNPYDCPQQPRSVKSCIIIHQNEIDNNNTSIGVEIDSTVYCNETANNI